MKESGRKNSEIHRAPIAPNSKLTRDLLSQLVKTRYFKTMTPEVLRLVLKSGEYLEVPEGTVMIEEGEQDTDMYFLLEGCLAAKSGGKVLAIASSSASIARAMWWVSSPWSAISPVPRTSWRKRLRSWCGCPPPFCAAGRPIPSW